MLMETRIFKSNRTQAVRLPKPVAFPDSVREVEIVALGRSRLITPAGESWDEWFDQPAASEDFMTERGQKAGQDRDGF